MNLKSILLSFIKFPNFSNSSRESLIPLSKTALTFIFLKFSFCKILIPSKISGSLSCPVSFLKGFSI